VHSTRLRSRIAPAVSVLALFVAGCGATVSGSPSPAGSTPPAGSAAASAHDQGPGAPSGGAVDGCALIPAADVEALIGPNSGGMPLTAGDDGGGCTWENPDNSYSVTVDIGQTGTAASGKLPAWDPSFGPERPLPDGMRSLGGGQVQFVAGDRLCDIQLATNAPGNGDQQKAVELARAIRGRL
jgi:Protein of unknown function (DUF3558).